MTYRITGQRTVNREPRRRPRPYRPLVERLEDRLPPGDTILASLLAGGFLPQRAAGLIPAVEAGRPGPARPLAVPAFELPLRLSAADADDPVTARQTATAVAPEHPLAEP